MPTKERNHLRNPFWYGVLVRELDMADYKPWLIAKYLRMPGNFTIRYKRNAGKVEVWSIFPEAVEKAIERSLAA